MDENHPLAGKTFGRSRNGSGGLPAAEHGPEQSTGRRADQQELKRQGQQKVPAVGEQVVGDELRREAEPVPDAEDAGQCDLTDDREDLNVYVRDDSQNFVHALKKTV